MKRSKHGLFVFPPKKTLIWRRHCLIGQSCCSMTSSEVSPDLWKVLGHEVFSPERSLNQPKPTRGLYPFDEPIKSLFFRSFVVSVSFESFHFKVIRKSLYLLMCNDRNVLFFAYKLETYRISSNNSRGWLFLFSHKKEAMIISNITHWKSNKLNMGFLSVPNLVPWLIFRAWIVTDQFCWISLHFNLSGKG